MKEKFHIYYWSPFVSKVATVNAVLGSATTLRLYSKDRLVPHIINVAGEWNGYENYLKKKNIKIIKLTKLNVIDNLNFTGFFKSRVIYFFLFLVSFIPLLKLLKKNPPEYFIMHLITPLPLFLNFCFNFKTNFILRISGLPRLSILRKFFWRLTLRKVHHITCPTKATMELIKKYKLSDAEKISVLYDPIISNKFIMNKKKEKFDERSIENKNYYLAIGRLTKQKNFKFLIEVFSEFLKTNDSKLIIIGEGEEKDSLQKFIKKKNLKNRVVLIGFKNNVFKYLEKSKCFILSSLWEDPGFVLVESAYMNTPIISSDCENGPKEILGFGKNGILFKSNNKASLLDALLRFEKMDKKEINQKLINCKKDIKVFTYFYHFKSLEKILYAN